MKLPHGDKVIIDQRKVVDYCLSPDHDDGKHKARLFENLLGLKREHAGWLLDPSEKLLSAERLFLVVQTVTDSDTSLILIWLGQQVALWFVLRGSFALGKPFLVW